jgi:diguanylate cyclase (GGDEF)-like protein/PAS domain S-box-containing protein
MIPGENRESLLREHQAIFENAAIGIIYSRGHRIERCNRHIAELFGYSVDELAGREAAMLYATTDDYVRLRQAARADLSAGRPYSGNVEMRRKDGAMLLTRLSARLVDPDAPEPAVVWTIEDIDRQRHTELALDLAERELEVIFDSAVAGITLVRHRLIVRCNRRIEELFGFAPGEMTGKSTRAWYRSDEEYMGIGAEAYATLSQDNYHCRQQVFIRKDGSTFWGEIAGRALDPHNPQEGSVWMIEDISERREMLQRLELAQRVFENSSESIMVTDAGNRIVSVNRAYERMTGFAAADVLGRNPGDFKSGRHDAAFYQALWQDLRDKGRWQGEIWDRRHDGSIYPKLSCIDVVRDADGKVVNYVAVFSDISERKASEDEANFLAHHDPLTGLSNRLALGLHLGHALAVARRNRTRVAVLFIDLDGFKPVNDRYGHAAGDTLLVTLAGRFRQMARETDLVARLGGDEFVIVMEGSFIDDNLAEIGADLVALVAEPCPLATGDVTVSCSIGIACSPRDGETAEVLLAAADVAMYRAKAAGRGNCKFFTANGGGNPEQA